MKRFIWGSVGIALGLGTAAHADGPQVIASNRPQEKVAAVLGAPAPVQAAPGILPVSAVYRAQKEDAKPMPAGPGDGQILNAPTPLSAPTLLKSPSVPGTPLGAPVPAGQPYTLSGPVQGGTPSAEMIPPSGNVVQPNVPPPPPGGPGIPPGATVVPGPGPAVPCTNCGPQAFATPPYGGFTTGLFAYSPAASGQRWYASAEYLYWWLRDANIPPLVTTAPFFNPANPADPNPGALGGPGTTVLYGNNSLDTQGRSGFRFQLGRWFGPCEPWAIEGGFFLVGQRSNNFFASGSGADPALAISRPFFNVNTGRNDAEIVVQPGVRGDIAIDSTSNFYGANLDWRRKLWCRCGYRIDGVLGFRYLNFDEDLNITENLQTTTPLLAPPGFGVPAGSVLPVGTRNVVVDRFSVDNDFYGGTIGVIQELQRGRWNFTLNTRVSLGNTHERLEIAGAQSTTVPGNPTQNLTGGLLTRPSNIGVYTADQFAVVPEVNFNIGYQVGPHWKIFAGYTFLYWNNMLRVGDQIDTAVNVTGVPSFAQFPTAGVGPGTNRPIAPMKETDFWAQGVNAGFQFTW